MSQPRVATAVVFAADGAAYGLWVAHLSVIRERFDLDPATLACVLLTVSGGAIAGTFVGTRVMLATSDSAVLRIGIVAAALLTVRALDASSLPTLFVTAFAFAVALGATEVAMNAVASRVQIAANREWMSSFHGFWSVGFFASASLTAALLARSHAFANGRHMELIPHELDVAVPGLLLAALAIVGAAISGGSRSIANSSKAAEPKPGPQRLDEKTRNAVFQLAAVVFFGWLGEGALTDWAPVFMTLVAGQTVAVAAGVSTAYGLAMTCARFAGDPIVERFGARAVLIVSTSLAALSVAVAVALPNVTTSTIAFACGGAAIANLSPLVFTLGGKYGGRAVGILTSIGYAAFLSGPAMLGGAAHFAGLRAAFAIPITALVISAFLASRLRQNN